MPEPSFFVIGAQKGGTTWLYENLRVHPEVFAAEPKSLYFFDKPERYARGLDWYLAHFAGVGSHKAAGEFTPNYFWEEPGAAFSDGGTVPERVRAAFPRARIIVSLRSPVERAVSAYYHHVRAGRVRPDQRLLEVAGEHGILDMGYYDEHLERWLGCFRRDQLLVLLYERDIARDKQATLERLYDFIGVDPGYAQYLDERRYNTRRSYLYMHLNGRAPLVAEVAERVLPSAIKNHPRFAIAVGDDEREQLRQIYEPHDARLARLLGCELPWRT